MNRTEDAVFILRSFLLLRRAAVHVLMRRATLMNSDTIMACPPPNKNRCPNKRHLSSIVLSSGQSQR